MTKREFIEQTKDMPDDSNIWAIIYNRDGNGIFPVNVKSLGKTEPEFREIHLELEEKCIFLSNLKKK